MPRMEFGLKCLKVKTMRLVVNAAKRQRACVNIANAKRQTA